MKLFLKKVSILLLLLLLGSLYGSHFLRVRSLQLSQRGTLRANYDCVILGSSRANHHINPIVIDTILNVNSINLGFDNSCLDYHTARFQELLMQNNHQYPRYVIWQIDMLALNCTQGFYHNIVYPFFLFEDLFADSLCKSPEFKDFMLPPRMSIALEYIVFKYYWKRLKDFYTIKWNDSKGFLPVDQHYDGNEFLNIDSIYFQLDKRTQRIFKYELDDLSKHNVKVVFVYSPVIHEAVAKIVDIDSMYSAYEQLAKEHNIPILDYLDCEMSNDTSFFYNATHLNVQGANLFSHILAHDLDSLFKVSYENN